MVRRLSFWLAAIVVLGAGPAAAQVTATDPARTEERLPDRKREPQLEQAPNQGVKGERKANAVLSSFTLTHVVYEGRTAVAEDDLKPAYRDFIGKTIGEEELRLIVQRVTDIYRARGYSLSTASIPGQSVVRGVLTVKISEGYVGGTEFVGLPQGSLRGYFDELLAEKPAQQKTIDRALLQLDDLNGINVADSYFAASPGDPDRYTLYIELEIDDAVYTFYADNRGTKDSGRDQVFASASLNSVATEGDRVTLAVSTVPSAPKELLYGELTYELPLHFIESWLDLTLSTASIEPGDVFKGSGIKSKARRFLARFNHPLIFLPDETLWLGLAFDVRHTRETAFGTLRYEDDLRVVRAVASYIWAESAEVTNSIKAEISRGIDGLGASQNGDAFLSRAGGEAQFTKLTVDASRNQAITDDISLNVTFTSQIADGPLLSAEEFVLGGPVFGRAHDYAELAGDNGWAALAELSYTELVEEGWLNSVTYYGYVDGGAVWNIDPLFEADNGHLMSLGAGVRLGLPDNMEAAFELAQPLSRSGPRANDRRIRPYLSFSIEF